MGGGGLCSVSTREMESFLDTYAVNSLWSLLFHSSSYAQGLAQGRARAPRTCVAGARGSKPLPAGAPGPRSPPPCPPAAWTGPGVTSLVCSHVLFSEETPFMLSDVPACLASWAVT